MFSVLIVLGALCGLLRYLKAPPLMYWVMFLGAAALTLAARFALPEVHPLRANFGDDLDGLVVAIFVGLVVVAYRQWFVSLKMRKQSLANNRTEQHPKQGFVVIADDAALTRDVEALLNHESFSLLRRDASGQIAVACKVRIEGDVARLGTVYASDRLSDLIEAIQEECDWRDAKMLVIEMVAERDVPVYVAAGFVEFGRFETSAGLLLSMKKDLT